VNHAYHALRITALTPDEEARIQRLTQMEHDLVTRLCEAELAWREFERRVACGDVTTASTAGLPLRAVWPARSRLSTNGGTQSCALCLDDIPEPYTLCDVCGVKFTAVFRERHGIDLDTESLA
jgi:hypothetical protein